MARAHSFSFSMTKSSKRTLIRQIRLTSSTFRFFGFELFSGPRQNQKPKTSHGGPRISGWAQDGTLNTYICVHKSKSLNDL